MSTLKKTNERAISNAEMQKQIKSVNHENAFIYAIFNTLKKETKDKNGKVINKELSTELKRIGKNSEIIGLIGTLQNDEIIKLIANNLKFSGGLVGKLAIKYDDLMNTVKADERAKLINEFIFTPLAKGKRSQNATFKRFINLLKKVYNYEYTCTTLSEAKEILKICPQYFIDNKLIEFFVPINFETEIDEFQNFMINTYKISDIEFYQLVKKFPRKSLVELKAIQKELEKIFKAQSKAKELLKGIDSKLVEIGLKDSAKLSA